MNVLLTLLGFRAELPLDYAPGSHNGRASSPENVRKALTSRNSANRKAWHQKYDHFCANEPVDHLRRCGAI